jgi:hypothetical protein
MKIVYLEHLSYTIDITPLKQIGLLWEICVEMKYATYKWVST